MRTLDLDDGYAKVCLESVALISSNPPYAFAIVCASRGLKLQMKPLFAILCHNLLDHWEIYSF